MDATPKTEGAGGRTRHASRAMADAAAIAGIPRLQQETPMKKLVVILAAVFAIAGCNTMAGAGKDIEAGGKAIEKSAEDTKKKM